MLTIKTVKIPIYKYYLKVVVFDDFEELKKKFPEIPYDSCKGLLLDYGNTSIICVPPDDISTIVHECEHAKNAIWKYIGFTSINNNDEPDAYLIGYLYEEIMKVTKKHLAS